MRAEHRFYVIAIALYLLAAGFVMSDSFGMVALLGALATVVAFVGLTIEGRRG